MSSWYMKKVLMGDSKAHGVTVLPLGKKTKASVGCDTFMLGQVVGRLTVKGCHCDRISF